MVLGTGHLFAANGIAGKEKSLNVDDSPVGKLLMYNSNRLGPRTEPWGTPESTGAGTDLVPLTTTD